MNKKTLSLVVLILLIALLAVSFTACNKDENKEITISDIFKSTSSLSELTTYELEVELPNGWEVYTSSASKSSEDANKYSDVRYVKSINGFIVVDTSVNNLSIVKCGDTTTHFNNGNPGMLFPSSMGIGEIRIKNNLIACKLKNGEVTVYDFNGKKVLSNKYAKSTSAHIDSMISILDSNLIAISGTYDIVNGISKYVSIYRPSTSGDVTDRGLFICNLSNPDNDLTYVKGFDGKYVSIVGNDEGRYLYNIPYNTVGKLECTENGTIEVQEDVSDYYCEITYIGNGKFFIHEDWSVSKSDNYLYYDGDDYYIFDRYIYTPENDTLTPYTNNSDKVFLTLSNNYYDSDDDFNTVNYLNDGYTYAAYGLYIIDKVGYYDQYILDSNMNIVMSLTGNFGIDLNTETKNKVGYYDLIMVGKDGYYYNPLTPSEVNIYNNKSELIGNNEKSDIASQVLSNGVIVAATIDSSSDTLYGGFNLRGEQIIAFNYTQLYYYKGAYTAGKRDNQYYIIGKDGYEITEMTDGTTPFSDMATTSSGTYIIKNGCYMFKKEVDNQVFYGIKNFNPDSSKNVIMTAFLEKGSMLYSPSTSQDDVFVFSKITNGDLVKYKIYRIK